MSPGSCWAFRGDRGVVVVALLGLVRVSAVSLEHIAASQAPTGVTLSAPKAFAVLVSGMAEILLAPTCAGGLSAPWSMPLRAECVN